jgi:hypothetical protein
LWRITDGVKGIDEIFHWLVNIQVTLNKKIASCHVCLQKTIILGKSTQFTRFDCWDPFRLGKGHFSLFIFRGSPTACS